MMAGRASLISQMKKKKVGVLLGGLSAEREISLKTGAAVVKALRAKGYKVAAIDAGRGVAARLASARIGAAFVALHGRYGEDGCIQGLLEVMGIPYTGSGVRASAVCMDKAAAKQVMIFNGIPTPQFSVIDPGARACAANKARVPFVVKPASQGSALGVTVVRAKGEVEKAVRLARRYGGAALIEEFIEGRELTVSILNGKRLPIIEIRPKKGFYDYKNKYTKGATEFVCPALLTKARERRVYAASLDAYTALGCAGAARVDVIIDAAGRPYVLEVNTVPGLTELSLFPRSAACAGYDYPALVEEMLIGAGLNK